MEIRILGPGCPRCHEVERRTINVLAEMNLGADIQRITDFKEFARYKVFATPGLVINNKVKCTGRIPTPQEIKRWIQDELEQKVEDKD